MNWQQLLEESISGIGLYAIFSLACNAVEAGTATEAQKKLVDSFNQVLSDYKNKALLYLMIGYFIKIWMTGTPLNRYTIS